MSRAGIVSSRIVSQGNTSSKNGRGNLNPGKTRATSVLLLAVVFLAALLYMPAPSHADEGNAHPVLAIDSPAPDFCLPGVDDKTHCLKDYAASKVLVIAFICNHCPTSQLYESRIKQIAEDYKNKGRGRGGDRAEERRCRTPERDGSHRRGRLFAEMKIRSDDPHLQLS